jgi:methylmalonyl-CoA/ethylmalonyl-CoA epimerase
VKFKHIGVAVNDIAAATKTYQDLFGYRVTAGPIVDPVQKVSVCFLNHGDNADVTIELVAPAGEDSPIRNLLAKGTGPYHLCYETRDLEGTAKEFVHKGCVVVQEPKPAVAFGGRRIMWLFTPVRQLVELLEA